MKDCPIDKNSRLLQAKEKIAELCDRLPEEFAFLLEPAIKFLKTVLFFLSEFKMEAAVSRYELPDGKGPVNILFIGKQNRLRFIEGLLGTEKPFRVVNRGLPPWRIKEYLESSEAKHDIVVMNSNKLLFRILRPEGFLLIPESVQSVLGFEGSGSDQKKKFNQNVLRKLNKVEKSDFQFEVSESESRLNFFYHRMYVPHIANRYRRHAVIENYNKVRRLLRTGFLVFVKTGGRVVAGGLCRIRKKLLVLELLGVRDGNEDWLKMGALDAVYVHCIKIGMEKQCEGMNFGISRPFLRDGLLRYKRKWGAHLIPNPKQCRTLGIKFPRGPSKETAIFLNQFPIFFDKGKISGLIRVDGKKPLGLRDTEHLEKAYGGRGIARLILCSEKGLTDNAIQYVKTRSKTNMELSCFIFDGLSNEILP